MALTGPRIVASIYAINNTNNSLNGAMGKTNYIAFGAGIVFYDAATSVGGVTINGIIEILPSGTQSGKKLYTNLTPAQIITAGS